ncbi:MAG: hypothetical protein AAGJ18_27210, partial [Bacteroidota bacterium]
GDCDADDFTKEAILALNSPKIRFIETVWDLEKYPNGTENAHQTDIAKAACTGDWLFYLQADEVIHEKYLPEIQRQCERYLSDQRVEGFLFHYKHFWGDYTHYQLAHGWYPKEIRIIRNHADIHSWESAQSFRRIPDFDGKNYRQQHGTHKLKVIQLDAEVYHYGWVRPPEYMQNKRKSLDTIHKGAVKVAEAYQYQSDRFDYGPLRLAQKFTETHPKVMDDWIAQFNWADALYENGPIPTNRRPFKHERWKYRCLTWIEQRLLGGKTLMGFKNFVLIE